MVDLLSILKAMVARDASDAHFKANRPPIFRIKRELVESEFPALSGEDIHEVICFMMQEHFRKDFELQNEIDFAYHLVGVGRFRVNVFRQRNNVGIVMRVVKNKIPSFSELNLTDVFEKICLYQSGIVLVTGASSMGKSTTLASMVEYLNIHKKRHIMTIEDPIEYIYEDKQSIINQREVGIDTESFHKAFRYIIRQDPDVILIGEMRDADTFQTALAASQTGHLVFSTLHSAYAAQAIYRILDFFPSSLHNLVRMQLSFNLKAVTCQKLMPKADGQGIIPAVEVMIANSTIVKLLRENKIEQIQKSLQLFPEEGMSSFNQSLLSMVKTNLVTKDDALACSDMPEALEMNIKGIFLDDSHQIMGE
ncbi:MAG: twitching motility protein [Candidatus Omnitrophota bacterium]|nr:MAG: twitching motility protein [Candidatus Omnitrophota bacterium]